MQPKSAPSEPEETKPEIEPEPEPAPEPEEPETPVELPVQEDIRALTLADLACTLLSILFAVLVWLRGKKEDDEDADDIPLPFGSARNSRDFINVKNLVEFIHLAVEKEVEGVFYPTDKVPYSTRNVVEEISRQLGVHTINLPSPSIFLKLIEKVRPDLYQKLWGDVVIDRQLALSAIGYEPRYTLEDGIREMVESFKQQK